MYVVKVPLLMVVPIDAYSCIVLDTGSLLIEICVKNSTSATNRVWHIYTVSVVYVFSHLLSEFSGFRVYVITCL